MAESQPPSQRARVRFAPPRWLIPRLSRAQVWAYRRTDGRIGGSGAGMRNLVLSTTGRRSGTAHAVCLPYWVDADGRRIVVASFAGAPSHPAWYHNLADRSVNPSVDVQVMGDRRPHVAEILDGDEYRAVWEALVSDRPFFADYQARTKRQIPLVRFVASDRR